LRIQARVAERRYSHGFTVEVRGDSHGRGDWSFERRGDWGHTTYDGQLRVTKPLIRFGSFLLKPLFAPNHSWVVRRGRENFRALPRRAAAGSATVWYPPA
jgi:hypothetical protein